MTKSKKTNIMEYLKMTDREVPASEIISYLRCARGSVTGVLSRAFHMGEVTRVFRDGRYFYRPACVERPSKMSQVMKIIRLLTGNPGMTSREINRCLGRDICGQLPGLMDNGKIVRTGERGQYRYYVAEKKKAVVPEPSISLSEQFALMDAPVFAAVRRRQEASCKA